MKKRIYSLILIGLMCFNMTAFAETGGTGETGGESEETSEYGTGLAEMTDEEWAAFNASLPQIAAVKPNEIALSRTDENPESENEPLSEVSLHSVAKNISPKSEVLAANENDFENEDEEEIECAPMGEETLCVYPGEEPGGAETYEYPFPLTRKVDVSQSLTFPPIGNQKKFGNCVMWSFCYYQMTNNICAVKGLNARTQSGAPIKQNIITPHFIYPLVNGGADKGSYLDEACAAIINYGCPTISQYPLEITESNLKNWCVDKEVWKNAMYNKPAKLVYSDFDTNGAVSAQNASVINLKKILSNGYVTTFRTYVNSFEYTESTTTGESGVRYMNNKEHGSHAMTIVGYDDDFWIDINEDGIQNAGETGAFKVANSWGKLATNYNDGFVWISYDAFGSVSGVEGFIPSRMPVTEEFYFLEPQKEYEPLYVAELTLSTPNRNQIEVTFGASSVNESAPLVTEQVGSGENIAFAHASESRLKSDRVYITPTAFSKDPQKTEATFPFDLTPLIKKAYGETGLGQNSKIKIYVTVSDKDDDGTPVKLKKFTITETSTGKKTNGSGNLLTANNKSVTEGIEVTVTPFVAYDKAQSLNLFFNNNIDPQSVQNQVYMVDSNNENVYPELSVYDNILTLYTPGGYIPDTNYTLHIGNGITSVGGNALTEEKTIPIYFMNPYFNFYNPIDI